MSPPVIELLYVDDDDDHDNNDDYNDNDLDNNDDYDEDNHDNNDDFIGQRKKTSSGAASVQLLLRPGFDLHIVI